MPTAAAKLPISAVLVIHNEEALIERCLRSCADLVDEIVVIHDGPCTDRSLEIARGYTVRVFVRERAGAAEPHRPETFRLAQHDWILQLDADEYLSDALRAGLAGLLEAGADAYDFDWPVRSGGRQYPGYRKTALFRKSRIYFIGATHEYAKPLAGAVVRASGLTLRHEPRYDNFSWTVFRKKWLPWARLHAGQFLGDFGQLAKWNYDAATWDSPNAERIRHPLLLGVFGTFAFHMLKGASKALRYRSAFYLKHELFYGSYYVIVFWTVFRRASSRP